MTITLPTMPLCPVAGCSRPIKCKGLCQTHYRRMRAGEPLDKPVRRTPPMNHEERLWANVDKTETCWLWTGGLNPSGYGAFSIQGRNVPAHRAAYTFMVGPVPEGLELDHLCRVRACVRPDHLEPVTRSVNVRRGIAADRYREWMASHEVCANGHALTPENIRPGTIRQCHACHRATWRRYYYRHRRAVETTATI